MFQEVVNRLTRQFSSFNCSSSNLAGSQLDLSKCRQLHNNNSSNNSSLGRQLPLNSFPPKLERLSSFHSSLPPSQHRANRLFSSFQLNPPNNSLAKLPNNSEPNFSSSSLARPNCLKPTQPRVLSNLLHHLNFLNSLVNHLSLGNHLSLVNSLVSSRPNSHSSSSLSQARDSPISFPNSQPVCSQQLKRSSLQRGLSPGRHLRSQRHLLSSSKQFYNRQPTLKFNQPSPNQLSNSHFLPLLQSQLNKLFLRLFCKWPVKLRRKPRRGDSCHNLQWTQGPNPSRFNLNSLFNLNRLK